MSMILGLVLLVVIGIVGVVIAVISQMHSKDDAFERKLDEIEQSIAHNKQKNDRNNGV
ncbi:MAG: hypothetical protein P8Y47_11085 [Alphaproteobacteria bacterium]